MKPNPYSSASVQATESSAGATKRDDATKRLRRWRWVTLVVGLGALVAGPVFAVSALMLAYLDVSVQTPTEAPMRPSELANGISVSISVSMTVALAGMVTAVFCLGIWTWLTVRIRQAVRAKSSN